MLDVSFGRVAGLPSAARAGLGHRLVRWERVAVLLPDRHPLAALPRVPLSALAGETLYAAAGNEETTEWTDYARSLFEGRGIHLAPPFPKIEGDAEFHRVVRARGWSVLASEEFTAVPGMTLCPLADPVPLTPVSMVWRRGLRHPGVPVLAAAAGALGEAEGWLTRPAGSWIPEDDLRLHEGPPAPGASDG